MTAVTVVNLNSCMAVAVAVIQFIDKLLSHYGNFIIIIYDHFAVDAERDTATTHTEKYFLNLVNPNQIWIVIDFSVYMKQFSIWIVCHGLKWLSFISCQFVRDPDLWATFLPSEKAEKKALWWKAYLTSVNLHTEKSFGNLFKSNRNQIVFTIFRLI